MSATEDHEPKIARCPGRGWDDLVREDSRPVPEFLAQDSYTYLGSDPIPVSRYISPEFFRREIERMWPRVWQYAAREEDLPGVGDYVVYENAGRSYLLVRQPDRSIKAFHNVCLHRGRKLRSHDGTAKEFRCPFHGFSWNTNGALREIPCRWDFPHLAEESMALPEAETGLWGGYIFVRETSGGPSLQEYLSPLPRFFERYAHEEQVTVAWVGKTVPANWKVVTEAFIEAFHAFQVHPQAAGYLGDANTRYCIYSDNIGVSLSPHGVVSPQLRGQKRDEQWIADQFQKSGHRRGTAVAPRIVLKEGETARRAAAEANRQFYEEQTGRDLSQASDAEMIDSMTYGVFPNFAPWGGFRTTVVYRFRPWPDVDRTLMEVRLLSWRNPELARARTKPMVMLDDTQPWAAAAELGKLGPVLDQDQANMPQVHAGMRASKTGHVSLGNYQEIRIRHLHQTLMKYLAD